MTIYQSLADLNIYDSPMLESLATQMAKGRYLQVLDTEANYLKIQLLEDGYEGLLNLQDLSKLVISDRQSYVANFPKLLSSREIRDRLPQVVEFIQSAMATPNEYLWGGTVAPNYDCSGLMQAAFAVIGVWIPRDAYQQEAFGDRLSLDEIAIGDLLFFGSPTKATHVGIYIGDSMGNDAYIHSSGKEHGHNGIAISELSGQDRVSQWYAKQLRGAARITKCFIPRVEAGDLPQPLL
ncbi:C40 family peptidase [Pseudanabaena sp. FACHB-1998]|uniref:C40 family peptidase n=1 Tax=Pseudanabaena sp. FACHB-1998 TaxID=2692858 RepID=UPI001681157A|nr:C40 family peptidase [Pseudanabaena sp. FACHB-1998]MBD2178323.1 C40 family peptidase [Pseudanabaena sp. FACHB-1998]